ncbi:serine/threonine-protein kinase gad8 [Trichoderma harzianum]|uniref:Serine/threonine-protein kinase gad8 n=1 Tax=Trichoderma harzianum TaxID=5544 RepID=A0A0F9ZUB5_TRIHA|nr:serine/threonine-protein kinase gad8 [Trichoderma harzianum]
MSWKLTKKLKDTHLGPLSAFSRSPSTSTITDKDEKGTSPGATTPTSESATGAADDLTQAPVIKKPGILVVTIHEGQGFSLPEQHRNAFASSHQSSRSSGSVLSGSVRPDSNGARPHSSGGGFGSIPTNHGRISGKYMPYALIDFDKVQVLMFPE